MYHFFANFDWIFTYDWTWVTKSRNLFEVMGSIPIVSTYFERRHPTCRKQHRRWSVSRRGRSSYGRAQALHNGHQRICSFPFLHFLPFLRRLTTHAILPYTFWPFYRPQTHSKCHPKSDDTNKKHRKPGGKAWNLGLKSLQLLKTGLDNNSYDPWKRFSQQISLKAIKKH